MSSLELRRILEDVAQQRLTVDAALRALPLAPAVAAVGEGHLRLDHGRRERTGVPEVVFAQGKPFAETVLALEGLAAHGRGALATRVPEAEGELLRARFPHGTWHGRARVFELPDPGRTVLPGVIAIVSAGSSDGGVAEEAAVTAEFLGSRVDRIFDAGVAGIHRLLSHADALSRAVVLVVVAGMEGALPSVVGGLFSKPVVAVPTSVGYGTSFGGIAALLAMLNSCAPGVVVVNIDNGFGAAVAAHRMHRLAAGPTAT